ncbi:MAG: ABC transporter permease subunit [Desulfococcaceae bacterium]
MSDTLPNELSGETAVSLSEEPSGDRAGDLAGEGEIALRVEDVWKVFGPEPEVRKLLASDRRNGPKDEIREETGRVVGVRNIDFTVKKGELFVLMGLSGSGKSTLIRCLIRLVDPSQGRILFQDEDISLIVGIPTGILMARNDVAEAAIKPILDAMQTMPSFVYLIPALMLFGLGKVPAVFATIIYAVPPVIRLTNVGIRGVPQSVIEAAEAFGSSPNQTLFNVQLPLAFPSIMVGINQTTMMALAMVVVTSMIGARTLGLEVLLAINRIEVGRGFEAGLSIVLLAIIIDRITHGVAARQRKMR